MWWDLSAYRLPLIAAALFFGWSLAANKLPKFDNGIAQLIGLFALLVVISQVVSRCVSWHPILYDHVLIMIFVTLATVRQLSSARHIIILALLAALSFGLMASKAGWQALLRGGTVYTHDLGGGTLAGSNAVALAAGMCLFLLLASYRALKPFTNDGEAATTLLPKSMTRMIRLGIPMVWLGLVALIITSESRGSAISTGVGLLLLTMISPNRIRNLTITVVLLVTFFVVLPNSDGYLGNISSSFAEEEELDASAASRPYFWGIAMEMANDHPIGVGVGCYVSNYSSYDLTGGLYGNNRSVHSSHFAVVAELGYPGTIIWIAILLAAIRSLWRARNMTRSKMATDPEAAAIYHLATGLLVALVVFIQGGNFYELTYNDFTWLIFAMAIACSKLAIAKDNASVENSEMSWFAKTESKQKPLPNLHGKNPFSKPKINKRS